MSATYSSNFDFAEHLQRKEYEKMVTDSENRLRSEQKDAEVRLNATCVRIENKLDDFRNEIKGEFVDFRNEVNEKFDKIDEKFDALDKKFEKKFESSRKLGIVIMVSIVTTLIGVIVTGIM